jgi:hypothetical protein
MEADPNFVTLDEYNKLQARWVRSEEHRRKLMDALVDLVDKNYGYHNGYVCENQIKRAQINDARQVVIDVTKGLLTEEDKERPFFKMKN